MTGFVTGADGRTWQLPPLTDWELSLTAGVPCDSFRVRCPWEGDGTVRPADWVRFYALEKGERVFTGVVDECEESLTREGRRLEITGRGMAAVLLDNETLPQDYQTATLQDILRDHVFPYGIQTAGQAQLPAVRYFSAAAGSSEWSVLYQFACYHAGVEPRFDRWGRLVLLPWQDGQPLLLDDAVPITALRRTDRRYGVLSQVLVRDRYRDITERVEDPEFIAAGGMARRVITMPGRSDWQSMRYSGQFQLRKAAAQRLEIEAEVAWTFWAWPGDLVRLQRPGWPEGGLFRVAAVTVSLDGDGGRSRLELAPPDLIL